MFGHHHGNYCISPDTDLQWRIQKVDKHSAMESETAIFFEQFIYEIIVWINTPLHVFASDLLPALEIEMLKLKFA